MPGTISTVQGSAVSERGLDMQSCSNREVIRGALWLAVDSLEMAAGQQCNPIASPWPRAGESMVLKGLRR